tara:strand:- start:662 stop:1576 length:915 start_codon:yes stop_codon:yes gene_type:complete
MSKYSDWRTDLREVMDDDDVDRKVSDKKVNNNKLIKINPKLGEAVEELGGQIIEMKEVEDEKIEKDADVDKKAAMADKVKKKEAMLKKRIVRMKMMAVNQGAADSIVAGYEPEGTTVLETVLTMIGRKKNKVEKKPEKAMDAGAKAKRMLARKVHAKYVSGSTENVPDDIREAKVDKGRSDYGKASIRNYRSKGPGHGEPAMFDPENKRGKLIDKRREEHKARRGVKGAKVPAYKVNEGEDKAFNYVLAKLKKQHGDGVMSTGEKRKPQSAADKVKARAHQAKVDKENAAERKKDPSQGRYPKG